MLQVGDWRVDPSTGVVSRPGTVRRLRPQVIDLFLALASRPAEVVSKQALLDSAWKGRFVSDSLLTTTIGELREALDDDAREPRYIQTVPKRGYRLIAPVRNAAIEPAVPTRLRFRRRRTIPRRSGRRRFGPRLSAGPPPGDTFSASLPLPPRSRCWSR